MCWSRAPLSGLNAARGTSATPVTLSRATAYHRNRVSIFAAIDQPSASRNLSQNQIIWQFTRLGLPRADVLLARGLVAALGGVGLVAGFSRTPQADDAAAVAAGLVMLTIINLYARGRFAPRPTSSPTT